jgi:hypothetical protein
MGLDQYAFARKGETENIEIMTWRKHANLEGWMADLYAKRGGKGTFNCIELKLTAADIDRLTDEYLGLSKTAGFFWGESRPGQNSDTADFLSMAENYLKDGYEIIYSSWW